MVIKQECFFLVDVHWTYTAGATAKVLIFRFFLGSPKSRSVFYIFNCSEREIVGGSGNVLRQCTRFSVYIIIAGPCSQVCLRWETRSHSPSAGNNRSTCKLNADPNVLLLVRACCNPQPHEQNVFGFQSHTFDLFGCRIALGSNPALCLLYGWIKC